MKKKIFLPIFFLMLMGIIPISCDIFCNRDSCGCGPIPGTKDYMIKTLRLETVLVNNQIYQTDRFYESNQIGLSIEVGDYEYVSEVTTGNRHIGFVSAAMACDPVPPQSVQKISSITITATDHFVYSAGQRFEMGEDISELFNINGIAFKNYISSERTLFLGENIYIKLQKAPAQPTELHLSLMVVLNDQSEHVFPDVVLKIK